MAVTTENTAQRLAQKKRNNQLSQRLLFGNTCEGGVGFPCLKTYTLVSYLLDVWRAIFCNDDAFVQSTSADALKEEQSCVHKKLKQLKNLLTKTSLHMTRDYFHVMTEQGPKALPINLKGIYKFSIFRQHGNFWNERIKKAADPHELPTITIVQKLKAVWSNNILNPTRKDVFYNFAFNLYRYNAS